MKRQLVFAGLCTISAYATAVFAEETAPGDGWSGDEAAELEEADDSPSSANEGLKWSTFSLGLSGRRGPMSGATGWWLDLILAGRTGFSGPVDIRFELSGGYGHPEAENQIPLDTFSNPGIAKNTESMDVASGLFRIQLEIPQDPLRLRIGPAVGAGTGKFESNLCGVEYWNRVMFGGGIDAVVGLGDPVFLEPFARFDILYLANPECGKGPPTSPGSPTLEDPVIGYTDNIGLFVGAGIMVGL